MKKICEQSNALLVEDIKKLKDVLRLMNEGLELLPYRKPDDQTSLSYDCYCKFSAARDRLFWLLSSDQKE